MVLLEPPHYERRQGRWTRRNAVKYYSQYLLPINAKLAIHAVICMLPKMSERPKIRLSRLRDIGWSAWDPIGLLDEETSWEDVTYADEYDGYLLRAAGMLKRNEPKDAVINYLIKVETEHMGLSVNHSTKTRAEELVRQILSDVELWSAPNSWMS